MTTLNQLRIAVVFASFNRKQIAVECLNRLRAQTRQPDLVIAADNHSTDGSRDAMASLNWDTLQILDIGSNLGSAGAIQIAMEAAFAQKCDAVWILDDDSWPWEDALEHLLAGEWDGHVVRHPIQIDPDTGNFSWPLQWCGAPGGPWHIASSPDELPQHEEIVTRGVWTGALISRDTYETVGPVNGSLFIRGEDEEYPWRIEKAGIGHRARLRSILDHPGPREIRCWKIAGKRLYVEPGIAAWKLYYKVRNMIWLKRRQSGLMVAMLITLAYALAILRFDGAARLRIWWIATSDAWRNRLGKRDSF